ncbi:unnamed protein product [Moneuplotes crassus]|uniref:DNA topoisomerase n=1 Tax=Euplotes crassus TaxID=5936 RepID=A0AAD1U4X5_EUPCR|nr:unnamed protein product [Moneuplotes crassus]
MENYNGSYEYHTSAREMTELEQSYQGAWANDLLFNKPTGFKNAKKSTGKIPKKLRQKKKTQKKSTVKTSVQDHTNRVNKPSANYREENKDVFGSDSDQEIKSEESSDDEKDDLTKKKRKIEEGKLYALDLNKRLKKIYKENGVINIAMIAEKPKVARSLLKILLEEGSEWYEDDYKGHKVLQFQGEYKGMIANFNILSVYGHIYRHAFQKEHILRKEGNPMKTFEAELIKNKPARGNMKDMKGKKKKADMKFLVRHLCYYIDGSDMIVLWFDNDTSGENICFQIRRMLQNYRFDKNDPYSKTWYRRDNIMRAKFSSLSRKSIFDAFNNLKTHPDEKLALAHDLRSEIDLRLGISFSVLLSNELQSYLRVVKDFTTSYGPCQFPTFWFVYQRQAKIDNALAQPYWLPVITIETQRGVELELEFKHRKFETKREAKDYIRKTMTEKFVKVYKIEYETEKLKKPEPMNTVDLLSKSSSEFGYTVEDTKKHAQSLYTDGLISYPRTHSRVYDEDYEEDKVLEMLERNKDFKLAAYKLRKKNEIPKLSNNEEQDHPPITPVHNVSKYRRLKRNSPSSKLYNYISNYFFASISHDCILETVTSEFKFGGETLEAKFSNIVDQGYLEHLPLTEKEKKMLNISEANLNENKQYRVKSFKVQKRFPPTKELLSEPELIKKMEKHRIGTDGTIPTHIETIIKRRYVTVQEGADKIRRFKPTKKGIALAEGFKDIDPELFEPTVRRYIEYQWKKVAKGRRKFRNARNEALSMFKKKLEMFISNKSILHDKLSIYIDDIKKECEELAEKEEEEKEEREKARDEEKRQARDEEKRQARVKKQMKKVFRGIRYVGRRRAPKVETEAMLDYTIPRGRALPVKQKEVKYHGLSINTIADLYKVPADHRRGDEYLLYEEEVSTQAGTDYGD